MGMVLEWLQEVGWNDEVVEFGRSPIRKSPIKIKKNPAGTKDASRDKSESESISREPTPPPKKKGGKPKSSTPTKSKEVGIGDGWRQEMGTPLERHPQKSSEGVYATTAPW